MNEKIHPITLFDTYLKKEVNINLGETVEAGKIKMYSCGPTVYSTQHIGNMRAAWFPDTLRKIAQYAGWEVEFVHNITDVGHLTGDNLGDADSGEDRLEKGAKREGKTVQEIVEFYLNDYLKQTELLGVDIPTGKYQPKATEYIKEQMVLALTLLKNGKAYLTDDGIYLDSQLDRPSLYETIPLTGAKELEPLPITKGSTEVQGLLVKESQHKLLGLRPIIKKIQENIEFKDKNLPLSRGSHEVGGVLTNYTGRDIVQTQKIHPQDFAVWKFVTEDNLQKWKFENVEEVKKLLEETFNNPSLHETASSKGAKELEKLRIQRGQSSQKFGGLIESKWGTPGWHSECVAMIASILGDDKIDSLDEYKNITGSTEKPYLIDIHCGGEEHIPIHHQDEILQSEALGFHLSRYWLHWKHVLIDGGKMGKSLGNAYTVHDIVSKSFDPLAYRLLLLEHHYGDYMNFTWDKLEQSQNRLHNLRKEVAKIRSFSQSPNLENYDATKYETIKSGWLNILCNNLNIPKFLDQYQEYVLYVANRIQAEKIMAVHDHKAISEIETILKLKLFELNLPNKILESAEKRWEVKNNKEFTLADQIRKEVLSEGWQIDDYSWGWGIWWKGC